MRSRKSIEGRLESLEEGSGPLIDDLADLVRWCAEDCSPNWRWDPTFEGQMEELAEKAVIGAKKTGERVKALCSHAQY